MIYPAHIQHTINKWHQKIKARIASESFAQTFEQTIDTFIQADPTPGKNLVDWIAAAYVGKGFRWEDVAAGETSKVFDTLKLYRDHYKKLQAEKRNLYDYEQLGEVYRAIQPFIPVSKHDESLSGKALKRLERERALSESIVIYRSNNMIVAVPLTEQASCWWGRGTRWCTAALKENYFEDYNKQAPLIVITLMNKTIGSPENQSSAINSSVNQSVIKLQLWATLHSSDLNKSLGIDMCFMDETDSIIQESVVVEHWKELAPILYWYLGYNAKVLEHIPGEYLTQEICMGAIKTEGFSLQNIPVRLRNQEICCAAVERSGSNLTYVPIHMITQELAELAIETSPVAFRWIPELMITEEMCMRAIKKHEAALYYIPESFRTYDFCKRAVIDNPIAFGYVHVHMKTEEMCRIAIKSNGLNLMWVPDKIKTKEICRIAVENNFEALANVPYNWITKEICSSAIEKSGMALRYIPIRLITQDMSRAAVSKTPQALQWISIDVLNEEICRLAVTQDGMTLDYVPERFRTDEIVRIAISQNPDAAIFQAPHKSISSDPEKLWNENILEGLKASLNCLEDNVRTEYLHNSI